MRVIVVFVLTILALISFCAAYEHTCIHDKLPPPKYEAQYVPYANHPHKPSHSRVPIQELQQQSRQGHADDGKKMKVSTGNGTYQSIRIVPFYQTQYMDPLLTQDKINMIMKLVPDAIAMLANMIKVSPVANNLTLACTSSSGCSCYNNFPIPTAHVNGSGVANADVIVYVYGYQDTPCPTNNASAGVLAFASFCRQDQYDRPIAGYINLCPYRVTTDPTQRESQTMTIAHELTHLLGYSASLFAFYRDASNNPRTPRDSQGLPLIISGDHYQAANNTVASGTERGKTVTRLVTENIVAWSRAHFACSTLPGVELEDQGGSGTIGSHWEKRLVMNELMSGIVTTYPTYSGLTLACLKDSGWYDVDYTKAMPLVVGKNAGCNFIQSKCITNAGAQDPVWCTSLSNPSGGSYSYGCTFDRLAKGFCNLQSWSSALPSNYQYFADTTQGGSVDLPDYCPFYNQFGNGICAYTDQTYAGETFGNVSRCFSSTLFVSGYTGTHGIGCYNYYCSSDSSKMFLNVGGAVAECDTQGDSIYLIGYSGFLTCPNFTQYCQLFAYKSYQIGPTIDSLTASSGCSCQNGGQCVQNGMCLCPLNYRSADCSATDVSLDDYTVEMTVVSGFTTGANFITSINSKFSVSGTSLVGLRWGPGGSRIVGVKFVQASTVVKLRADALFSSSLTDIGVTNFRTGSSSPSSVGSAIGGVTSNFAVVFLALLSALVLARPY